MASIDKEREKIQSPRNLAKFTSIQRTLSQDFQKRKQFVKRSLDEEVMASQILVNQFTVNQVHQHVLLTSAVDWTG
jgi:hypothetical protein